MSDAPLSAIPVADLHCDLLSYLVRAKKASLQNTEAIGVALPHLESGNVELQTLAIFNPTESRSTKWGDKQVDKFVKLGHEPEFHPIRKVSEMQQAMDDHKIGIVAAVENASGFCEEDEPLDFGFEKLEEWINRTGRIFYISLTHHTENRFGGGNYSDNVGLKADGEALLDWLDSRQICVDLSHASDQLAYDILDYSSRYGLNVPIIASHSNFRSVHDHVRNLPDEIAKEILSRGGIIGLNFFRDYVHPEQADYWLSHLDYGWKTLDAPGQIVFGADFFHIKDIPDPERQPLFHPGYDHAGHYPALLQKIHDHGYSEKDLVALAHGNVIGFIRKIWQ